MKHPQFGADMAWELTKRGSKDYLGVQAHPRHNVKFAHHTGKIFVKSDTEEEATLQEPAPLDDKEVQEDFMSARQNTKIGE